MKKTYLTLYSDVLVTYYILENILLTSEYQGKCFLRSLYCFYTVKMPHSCPQRAV